MKVVSRTEAAKRGLTRYYTGRPCAKGHDAERYTTNGVCLMCNQDSGRKFNQKMREMLEEARGVAA